MKYIFNENLFILNIISKQYNYFIFMISDLLSPN